MLHASCLCGAVTWTVEGTPGVMSHCHCGRCRKAHGVAFVTYAGAPATDVQMAGTEHVARWTSSPGFDRCFCRRCGSVVPGDPAPDGVVYLPAGNFDEDPGLRPRAHLFVAAKAPWYEITDDLLRFDAYPPGIDAPVLPDRPPIDPPGAGCRGSCLCGAVAFTLDRDAVTFARYCHCGRCRKQRSAAHATNAVANLDGLRFTRGADHVDTFHLPGARFFAQTFCRTCGAAQPRLDADRRIAVVPLGALDDDPGVRAGCHIFVGAKAPWFTITDGLPRHEGYPPA